MSSNNFLKTDELLNVVLLKYNNYVRCHEMKVVVSLCRLREHYHRCITGYSCSKETI